MAIASNRDAAAAVVVEDPASCSSPAGLGEEVLLLSRIGEGDASTDGMKGPIRPSRGACTDRSSNVGESGAALLMVGTR